MGVVFCSAPASPVGLRGKVAAGSGSVSGRMGHGLQWRGGRAAAAKHHVRGRLLRTAKNTSRLKGCEAPHVNGLTDVPWLLPHFPGSSFSLSFLFLHLHLLVAVKTKQMPLQIRRALSHQPQRRSLRATS